MAQFKIDNAVVRIHGSADDEKLKAATLLYLKKVRDKKNEKKNQKSAS